MNTELSSIEPFEIAFIRPPTENQSLAFRLTRNCYWNHCAFCPADRESMLKRIDAYLDMPERERRLYSLKSRINAFEGQYGGLSEDIYNALSPYIKGGGLDLDEIPSGEAQRITKHIRAKLMP